MVPIGVEGLIAVVAVGVVQGCRDGRQPEFRLEHSGDGVIGEAIVGVSPVVDGQGQAGVDVEEGWEG